MKSKQDILNAFNKEFRNEKWYPDNWEPVEAWLLTTLTEFEREAFERGRQEGTRKEHERLQGLANNLQQGTKTLLELLTEKEKHT